MLATALVTPLPRYRDLSASLSSSASRSPVDAPDGTPARPRAPPSSVTSTSTVGLPRESRISRPRTSLILIVRLGDRLPLQAAVDRLQCRPRMGRRRVPRPRRRPQTQYDAGDLPRD